jgi:preprotein translocase subunit YajC
MSVSLIFAAGAGGASANSGAALFMQFAPLVLIFVVFYFLLIRPQQRRMKEHGNKIAAVKRGDNVVTGGGLMGKVTKVEDDHVEVEIAQGVKVRAVKSTLADVLGPVGKPAND